MRIIKLIALWASISAISLSAATWKYALGEGLTDPQGIYATAFQSYIQNNSKHNLKIYAIGTLGEEEEMMDLAKEGLIQFIGHSTGYLGDTIPEMELFTLPYVMPSDTKQMEYFFKNSKVVNEILPSIFNKHGLELLSIFPEGEMAVTTFEEFYSPADLKGKKIRVMPGSQILRETYKAFGATPIAMSWGDLTGALKAKVVDGQENPTVWIEAYGIDHLTNVLTYTGHAHFNASVSANKNFFDKLNSSDKKLIKDAAAHAHNVILKEARNLDAYGLGRIIRTNPDYKIVTLTKEQRAPFKKAAKSVQELFSSKSESNKKILKQMMLDLEAAQKSVK